MKPPATFSNAKPLVHAEITMPTTHIRKAALVKFGALDAYMASGTTGTEDVVSYWVSRSKAGMERGWKQIFAGTGGAGMEDVWGLGMGGNGSETGWGWVGSGEGNEICGTGGDGDLRVEMGVISVPVQVSGMMSEDLSEHREQATGNIKGYCRFQVPCPS